MYHNTTIKDTITVHFNLGQVVPSFSCLFKIIFPQFTFISSNVCKPVYCIPQMSQIYTRKLSIKLDEATAASVIYQLQLLGHKFAYCTCTHCIYNSISSCCILHRLQHFRYTRLAFICVDCDSLWFSQASACEVCRILYTARVKLNCHYHSQPSAT